VAGNLKFELVNEVFKEKFGQNNICYDLYKTTGEEDITAIIKEAQTKNYTMMVAVGGDGTVSEVAEGLVGSETPLGIIPLGTGNLVARELDIPLKLEEACDLLIGHNRIARLDIMQMGRQMFIPHLSLGVYSQVISDTGVEEKRRFGMAAYFWNALREIQSQRFWNFMIRVDDQEQYVRAPLIMLANIGIVGIGEARWGPDIRPDDGEIDVCIIRARRLKEYLQLFWHLLRQQPVELPKTIYLKARREILVKADRPIPVRMHGETRELGTVHIKIMPQAVKVIVSSKQRWREK
jgi:YegS/Rv2252/BmrU family lipid kinase